MIPALLNIRHFIILLFTVVAGIFLFKGIEKGLAQYGWLDFQWPIFIALALMIFLFSRRLGFNIFPVR